MALSTENIEACKRKAGSTNLVYREGDAEALPFLDESFDIVLSVESSHDYPSFTRFFTGVRRVLLNRHWDMGLINSKDITANVVESLRLNSIPIKESIRSNFPNQEQFDYYCSWAHIEGTSGFNKFRDRLEVYSSFVFQKEK